MAVVDCSRLPETTAREDVNGRHYVQHWRIITNDRNVDTEAVIFTTAGLPRRLEYNPDDETTACSEVVVSDRTPLGNGGDRWVLEIAYEPVELVFAGHNGQQISILTNKRWWVEFVPRTKPLLKAYKSNQLGRPFDDAVLGPVANSIGDRFDPPYEYEDYNPVLVYERNELSLNLFQSIAYAGAINTDPFLGLSPYQARCYPIAASPRKRDRGLDIYYYTKTYRIELQDAWVVSLLNQGSRAKDANGVIYSIPNGELRNLNRVTGEVLGPNTQPDYLNYAFPKLLPFGPLAISL